MKPLQRVLDADFSDHDCKRERTHWDQSYVPHESVLLLNHFKCSQLGHLCCEYEACFYVYLLNETVALITAYLKFQLINDNNICKFIYIESMSCRRFEMKDCDEERHCSALEIYQNWKKTYTKTYSIYIKKCTAGNRCMQECDLLVIPTDGQTDKSRLNH